MASDETPEPAEAAGDERRGALGKFERMVDPRRAVHTAGEHLGPAWSRLTSEEPRVQVTIAILVAVAAMAALPPRVANRPRWVLDGLALLLLAGVFVAKSARHDRRTRVLRVVSLTLIGVMSIANATSAGRMIVDLARAEGIRDPATLLRTGALIWVTNVIIFGLWYWEFDRGGPTERAAGSDPYPDLLFPQMTSPELAPADWEPGFLDYLYVSFTNAAAFSPTDVLPMTRWAKTLMMTQSAISVITVALVIARAVNILK